MWKTTEGSTGQLLQFCVAYFVSYVVYGVATKYFVGPAGMRDLEFLAYSTIGGSLVCLGWVLARGWWRLESARLIQWGPLRFPSELLYIVPSGVCTAVVIPTTTLMYTMPITVMVAMVIMRGSVIVISRLVDAIQIRQGILHKKVLWEENVAVAFAVGAVSVHLWFLRGDPAGFKWSPAATVVLLSYIASYATRIYIMNYYKNTRPPGTKLDNKAFFSIEQMAAFVTIVIAVSVVLAAPGVLGSAAGEVALVREAFAHPKPVWPGAIAAGATFGIGAFFSVFLFMFKGRTATFAGLVNRLTSLIAGTAATGVSYLFFRGKLPGTADWISLGLILVAVAFLSRSERRRIAATGPPLAKRG